MDYYNMKEAKEIDFAIDYISKIRTQYVAKLQSKAEHLGTGVITDVVKNLVIGLVDLENKEIDRLKERLKEL